MNIKVSIIVPVYNVEAYVEKCINSILMQTYKNYELILLNDGSTDNSYNVLLKYKDNPFVTIIDKTNTGQSDTRYQGLMMAEGDYVYFVDSDDYIEPYTLERLVAQVDKSNADVVFGRYRLVNEDGNILREQKQYQIKLLENKEVILRDAICFSNFKASLCLKLIKRNLLLDSYKEDVRELRVNEDMYLSILLASNCTIVIFINDIIYNILQREGSVSRGIKPELITSNEIIFKNVKCLVKDCNLWGVCEKDFYSGYLKSILYCLALAAIKCKSFREYKTLYKLLDKNSIYYSSELNNKKKNLSFLQRTIFILSRYPKIFFMSIKFFSSFLRY